MPHCSNVTVKGRGSSTKDVRCRSGQTEVDLVPLPFAPVRVGARAMAVFVSVFPLPLSFPLSILTVPTRAMGGRASSFPVNQRERCINRRFPCFSDTDVMRNKDDPHRYRSPLLDLDLKRERDT